MKYSLEGEETRRLKFRLLKPIDFEEWVPLFEEPEVSKFLALPSCNSPDKLCQIWFRRVFNRYENQLGAMNVLIEKSTGKMVGQCGLLVQNMDGGIHLEIGYSILPLHRGMGYAIEAAQKCRDYAFNRHLSESLISVTHIENYPSQKVAIKNGMVLKKTIESHKGQTVKVFRILKKDWILNFKP